MRRGRTLIIVGLLLIIVIAGGYLVYTQFLQPGPTPPVVGGEPAQPTQAVNLETAVRLTQPIQRGTELNETMLDTVSVPQEAFLPGMFTEFSEVVGRKARYDLEAGMLLTSQVILDLEEALPLGGSDWALVIEPGKVAVSIPISRLSAVSYAPQSGDSVDVIATMVMIDLDTDFQTVLPNSISNCVTGPGLPEDQACLTGSGPGLQGRTEVDPALGIPFYVIPSEQNQRPRMVSQSILRNVTVLRVGDFPFEGPEGEMITVEEAVATPIPDDAAQQQGQQVEQQAQQQPVRLPDVITLIVNPQDAVTLNYLVFSGAELTLTLRAAGDESADPTEAVTLQFLLDEYNIPVPVKLPFGLENSEGQLTVPTLPNDVDQEQNQNP